MKRKTQEPKGKGAAKKSKHAHAPLTDREWVILQLISEGLSNQEISERLNIKITTVKWFVKQIFNKLGVFRRTQAIQVARQRNLIAIETSESLPVVGLPLVSVPLIGREVELSKLKSVVAIPTNRLVTILGPGGIGKTQMVLEFARRIANEGPTRVCFVELESIHSRDGIAPAIAAASGVQFSGSQEPEIQLIASLLDRKNFILILDNVEHLADIKSFIIDLLRSANGIKILCTSRERLHLQAESVFQLEGLKYPIDPNQESEYPSIRLFIEVAYRVAPLVQLNREDMNAIRRICNLVEGTPLAIELAARWMNALTPEKIAHEILLNSDALETHYSDVPERHRSIRAVFEYSWQLLSQSEKEVFARLSVFRGGFDVKAAEQVAGAQLFILSSLIDKSLVVRVGSERFKLHELLRQFAEEKLRINPDEYTVVLQRHCRFYAGVMRAYEISFKSNFAAYFNDVMGIQRDFDNIILGWNFALKTPFLAELGSYVFSLSLYYFFRGLLTNGERNFAEAKQRLEHYDGHDRILQLLRIDTAYGWYLSDLMHYEQAREVLSTGAQLAQQLDESAPQDVGLVLCFQGWVDYINNDLESGRNRLQRALSLCQKADFQLGVWICLSQLSEVEFSAGKYEAALEYQLQAIAIADRYKNIVSLLTSLLSLGNIYCMLGNISKASESLRQGLLINRDVLAPFPFFMAIPGIALLCQQCGNIELAIELLVLAQAHPQRGAAADHKIGKVLESVRNYLPESEADSVIEKVRRGEIRNWNLAPQFTISPELIDQFLTFLGKIESA